MTPASPPLPANEAPCLDGEAFEAAFPFYIEIDRNLSVISAGSAIQRAIPGLVKGELLNAHLSANRPRSLYETSDWSLFDRSPILLQSLADASLMFRGQICYNPNRNTLLLLTPVVRRFEELKRIGLQLSDLALHDVTGDMLMLQKAAETSLDDARRLSNRLRERGEQLRLMTELSGHGIAYFGPTGDLVQHNPLFIDLLEWPDCDKDKRSTADVEEHLRRMLIPADASRLDLGALAQGMNTSASSAPFCVQTVKGQHLRVRYHTTSDQAHLLFIRDITREAMLEGLKKEFMSTAAHELRTPMTSIFGFSEILVRRDLPAHQIKDMALTIYKQAQWMVSLLDGLLDLSKLESGVGVDLDIQPLPIPALIETTLVAYSSVETAGRVRVEVEENLPPIEADRLKAGQAIGNVLNNAFRYSPPDSPVDIRCRRQQHAGRNGVAIDITDRGIGMSPEQLDRVFERFYRADASCNIPGSGLGMSLVQQIMTLHGGHVSLRSEQGKGTCVALWFATQHAV